MANDDDRRMIAQTIGKQVAALAYRRAVRSGSNPVPTDERFTKLQERLEESENKQMK